MIKYSWGQNVFNLIHLAIILRINKVDTDGYYNLLLVIEHLFNCLQIIGF